MVKRRDVGQRMRLASHTEIFSLGSIPTIANYKTGGLIGLTKEGLKLCKAMQTDDVDLAQIPSSCNELVEHLKRGSYLDEETGSNAKRRAYLHVTQRCNLNCRFCYSENALRNHLDDPSLVDLKKAIDFLANWKATHLVISGGEPFLRDGLSEIALYARKAGIGEITLITNGTLITRENLSPLAPSVDRVAISFDGWSSASPAWLRGEQRFGTLRQKTKLVSNAGIKPHIIVTLHHKNIGDIPAYRALATDLGASLSFSMLLAREGHADGFVLTDEELKALGKGEAEHGGLSSISCRKTCGAGTTSLSVDADGTVYPCHMLHQPKFAMGNIFINSPRDIQSSGIARRFDSLDSRTFDDCQGCQHRPLCGGGCRARAYYSKGSLEAKDPYCALSSSYYSKLVDLISVQHSKTGDRDAV